MLIKELLIERIVNLFKADEKQKYADEVWDVLQQSYAPIGGFGTSATVDELIEKSGLWKLVVRNGNISALEIYRDQFGRKGIGLGTNGTYQGKKDLRMIIKDSIKYKRSWAEVSGKPEYIYKKYGGIPISATYAELLTKHPIISINDDGYHYTRLIYGVPKEKIIYGVINLSLQDREMLRSKGIKLHELPQNIKL
jgi:hypothetical protein